MRWERISFTGFTPREVLVHVLLMNEILDTAHKYILLYSAYSSCETIYVWYYVYVLYMFLVVFIFLFSFYKFDLSWFKCVLMRYGICNMEVIHGAHSVRNTSIGAMGMLRGGFKQVRQDCVSTCSRCEFLGLWS